MHKIETRIQRGRRTLRSLQRRRDAELQVAAQRMRLQKVKPPAKTQPRFSFEETSVELVRRASGEKYTVPGFRAVYIDRNKYNANGSLRKAA